MASVTSLGFHEPTGLPYAVQERLLPPDPPSLSYTWHNSSDGEADSSAEDDELLVTTRSVIWSRGGCFRQSYQFDLENEPVTQALFTYFPTVNSPNTRAGNVEKKQFESRSKSKALVVFLKTQAHIYFLSGSSHIIHLPFEVEFAVAAPDGLILQRKLRFDSLASASLKFPRAPPNSFVSSQPQIWSGASSLQSTFSVADLNASKKLPAFPNPTLQDLWEPPILNHDAKWPRLFSLSDPLSEMGLVVSQPAQLDSHGFKRISTKAAPLDTSEEILYISRRSEIASVQDENPLILALTLNRDTSMYTVWRVSYVQQESSSTDTKRRISGATSRRRSSFIRGTATGATTPIPSQQSLRESLAGNSVIVPKRGKKGSSIADKDEDFASTLDPDFENNNVPRRKSRRVSSMLARADLSASHERSGNVPSRRGDSLGGQNSRISSGAFANSQMSQFSQSLNSFLEAPVDDLLDELRAGGDFEGFHNMGLDDDEFDALRHEIVFSKITSITADHSNIRYSSQRMPAHDKFKIFTLTAPLYTSDERQKNTIVICILDRDEKRLIVLNLHTRYSRKDQLEPTTNQRDGSRIDTDFTVLTKGDPLRAKGVIDACRIDDGSVSRILVLTETSDGQGELTLQAPWSELVKISLPGQFHVTNPLNLAYDASPRARREGGFRRVLRQAPMGPCGLKNSRSRGLVDMLDNEGKLHQIQISMEPRNPHAKRVLEVCRSILPASRDGEGVLVGWWSAMRWLEAEYNNIADKEWSAVVITLLSLEFGFSTLPKQKTVRSHTRQKKSRSGFLRSSSGAQLELGSWETMQTSEASYGDLYPSWSHSKAWNWLTEPERTDASSEPILSTKYGDKEAFIQKHVRLTREFVASALGEMAVSTYLPTSPSAGRNFESRSAALIDIITGLHLLREEEKLNTMTVDLLTSGAATLIPVVAQMVRWLAWTDWIEVYAVEDACIVEVSYDSGKYKRSSISICQTLSHQADSPMDQEISQPFGCPSILDWIRTSLVNEVHISFPTISSTVSKRSSQIAPKQDYSRMLTPRTYSFEEFFQSRQSNWTAADFVEGLAAAGINSSVLDTLPEAVLTTIMEAIVQCQNEPPTTWNKTLLALVGREDVNLLLSPGQHSLGSSYTILVSAFTLSPRGQLTNIGTIPRVEFRCAYNM